MKHLSPGNLPPALQWSPELSSSASSWHASVSAWRKVPTRTVAYRTSRVSNRPWKRLLDPTGRRKLTGAATSKQSCLRWGKERCSAPIQKHLGCKCWWKNSMRKTTKLKTERSLAEWNPSSHWFHSMQEMRSIIFKRSVSACNCRWLTCLQRCRPPRASYPSSVLRNDITGLPHCILSLATLPQPSQRISLHWTILIAVTNWHTAYSHTVP